MRRSTSLVTLTLLGVFLTAATYAARPPRASIHVTEVADNLYMLGSDPAGRGMGTGGNTAVFVMANRVVLVDTKLAGYGPDILEQVRSITDKSVTTIINLNVTKTAAIVIDSGPQNTVRFGAGPLRFGSQVVARRIDVFGPFRAVMAGRIGTWVARDCHIRVNTLALQRAGSNRPLLLRPWPHRRRLVRCVQGRADHAHG